MRIAEFFPAVSIFHAGQRDPSKLFRTEPFAGQASQADAYIAEFAEDASFPVFLLDK